MEDFIEIGEIEYQGIIITVFWDKKRQVTFYINNEAKMILDEFKLLRDERREESLILSDLYSRNSIIHTLQMIHAELRTQKLKRYRFTMKSRTPFQPDGSIIWKNKRIVNPTKEQEVDYILSTVFQNKHLDKMYQQQFNQYRQFLIDMPYLENEFLYLQLKTVLVKENMYINETFSGSYLPNSNQIFIHNDDKLNFYHEAFHFFSTHIHIAGSGISNNDNYYGFALDEGITERLAYEYFDYPICEKSSMPNEFLIASIFCELLGAELLLRAYMNGNIAIITEELNALDDTWDAACFLALIDEFVDLESSSIDVDTSQLAFSIKEQCRRYYNKLDPNARCQLDLFETYLGMLFMETDVHATKYYFNVQYQKKVPETYYYQSENPEMEKILRYKLKEGK